MSFYKRLVFKLYLFKARLIGFRNRARVKNRKKIFVVGRNKTGTTSMKKSFEDLGFIVGQQLVSDYLVDKKYFSGDLRSILNYVKTAEVFQDVPFSLCEIIPMLDLHFPGSKFILTVRDCDEEWYNSLTSFHKKIFGNDKFLPSNEYLNSIEKYDGSGFKINVARVHGTPCSDPYNKNIMCEHYKRHNDYVKSYFKYRPQDLLVINLKEKGAYKEFINFIEVDSKLEDFPWENKT